MRCHSLVCIAWYCVEKFPIMHVFPKLSALVKMCCCPTEPLSCHCKLCYLTYDKIKPYVPWRDEISGIKNIVTDFINALSCNRSVNMVQPAAMNEAVFRVRGDVTQRYVVVT